MKFHLRNKSRRWFYLLLSLTFAWGTVAIVPQVSQAVPLERLLPGAIQYLQFSNISDKQEMQLGAQINRQLVNREVKLYRNGALNNYINDLGQKLARKSDRPNLKYTFQVVDDSGINAFATMGGYVYVNTGTIAAADNEAQLASVIAHEIGHIGGRHSIKQMKSALLAQGVTQILGVDNSKVVGIGVDLALNRPHSRRDEYDADTRGLRTMTRAGYAPSGATGFMKKLLNSGGGTPTFLSTHPGTQDRIDALQEQIDDRYTKGGIGLDNASYKSKIRRMVNS